MGCTRIGNHQHEDFFLKYIMLYEMLYIFILIYTSPPTKIMPNSSWKRVAVAVVVRVVGTMGRV